MTLFGFPSTVTVTDKTCYALRHHVIAALVALVARSAARTALPDILAPAALLALPARVHLQAPPLARPQERSPLEVSESEVYWVRLLVLNHFQNFLTLSKQA